MRKGYFHTLHEQELSQANLLGLEMQHSNAP